MSKINPHKNVILQMASYFSLPFGLFCFSEEWSIYQFVDPYISGMPYRSMHLWLMIRLLINTSELGSRLLFLDIGYVPWYHILRRTSYLFNIISFLCWHMKKIYDAIRCLHPIQNRGHIWNQGNLCNSIKAQILLFQHIVYCIFSMQPLFFMASKQSRIRVSFNMIRLHTMQL